MSQPTGDRNTGDTELFRAEVVERQTSRLHGDILVLPKFSHTLILGLLLFWVLLVLTWLLAGSYARKETVSGWLEPSEGLTRIYAEDGGLVRQVLVEEGQQVEADQPLLIINGDRHLADGDALEARLLTEYEHQQRLLTQQRENSERLYRRRQEELAQDLEAARQTLELLDQQLQTLNERHLLARELVERHQALRNRQFVSQSELENVRVQELSLRNERQGLLREKAQLENNINRLRIDLQALPDEQANERLQLQARLSDLAGQIAQLHGQRAYVIQAPRPGQVNNLQAGVGERVYANSTTPLLTLSPQHAQLRAELLVPVRAAGFVEAGQTLDIRYDAFPYQKFGLYKGEVLSISDTVLIPNELSNTPLRIEEPVYRITASVQKPGVHAYGRDFRLKPGMTLSADVQLAERSLLQWLLEPIYSLKGRL